MPEESNRVYYNWDDDDTEEVKRPQKSTDKAENTRRDIVADDDSSHRGMDDDNEPHALEPRQRDLEQSKISDHDELQGKKEDKGKKDNER